MHPIIRNILAVIAGVILGMMVNMGLVMLGPMIIPPPEGVNMTNMESINASIHLLQPKHYIFPFLAHSLGTLVGAFLAAKLAATHKMKFAIGIGAFFLLGGAAAAMQLAKSPLWFKILDLGIAYLPMGWLGGRLASSKPES